MTSDARQPLPAYAVSVPVRRDVQVRTDERAASGQALGVDRGVAVRELLRPGSLALLGLAAVLAASVLWALQDALIDDAFITLDYARTLAFHGDWGALPGIPSNTATSPLNVAILAAVTLVIRDPMVALWIVTILNAVVLSAGLIRLGSRWQVGTRLAWIATPLLILNPLLASSIGLETMMAISLFCWLLEAAVAGASRRFGWLAGVAIVLRPDLVVIAGVVWLLHPALRRPQFAATTLGTGWRAAVVGLPWYVFSWIYFGSAIPDTLVIKQGQDWGHYATGIWDRYHLLYPTATNAALVIAALGALVTVATPLLSRGRYRPVALSVASAGLAGAAYFAAYSMLGVPPYFWYYGLPLAGATLALAFAIAAASRSAISSPTVSKVLCAAACIVVLSPALAAWIDGLAERSPLREAPIHGNWAITPEYKEIGLALAEEVPSGAIIRSAGEFGTILYYCDCTLIDRFDQRGLIMPDLEAARDRSWLGKPNYLWIDPGDYPLLRQDYHLRYREGIFPPTDRPNTWDVYSPTRGYGRYILLPGSRPVDVAEGLAG
jgi:hypothetical protein